MKQYIDMNDGRACLDVSTVVDALSKNPNPSVSDDVGFDYPTITVALTD